MKNWATKEEQMSKGRYSGEQIIPGAAAVAASIHPRQTEPSRRSWRRAYKRSGETSLGGKSLGGKLFAASALFDGLAHRSGPLVSSALEGVGSKVGVDLGRAPRAVPDVLAGDLKRYATRDIPAHDVVS